MQWAADQLPELPFVGWDFAICDNPEYDAESNDATAQSKTKLFFIEANSMCSYSKYVGPLAPFYTFDECDTYLKGLSETTSETPDRDNQARDD